MLINLNEQIQKLKDVKAGRIKEGERLGIPKIDEYMRFKKGNLNVILGHANVGKTTVVLYLMLLYSIKNDTRWLIYSSENEAYTLIKKLIEFLEGKVINKVDSDSFNMRLKWVNEHFKFIDPNTLHTYKTLLSLGEQIHKAWGYDGFFIDPYNSLLMDKEILKGINSHEYHYQVTSEMRIFCKTTNVAIWLNTHAATEALRKKHGPKEMYDGHPIPPMASDVEGGGKFVNRADDFMVIHRYIQHPTDWMYSMIHMRKVKDIDTGGRPTPIDEPIRLRSIVNNVGFEINGQNLIQYIVKEQKIPF